jgi:hypothetical protein
VYENPKTLKALHALPYYQDLSPLKVGSSHDAYGREYGLPGHVVEEHWLGQ